MILTTTSKNPTREMRKFSRMLSIMIPNSEYQPRGSRPIERMIELARKKGYRRVILVDKNDEVKAIAVKNDSWEWLPKAINIKDIKISDRKFDFNNEFLREFFDLK